VSDLVQSRDLVHGSRTTNGSPAADNSAKRTYTEIVTPAAGYAIGNDAANGRLPKRSTRRPARAHHVGPPPHRDLARTRAADDRLEMSSIPTVSPQSSISRLRQDLSRPCNIA